MTAVTAAQRPSPQSRPHSGSSKNKKERPTAPQDPSTALLDSSNKMGSTSNVDTAALVAASMPVAPRTKRDRPCDACRRRKSKCVVPDGAGVCTACKFHTHECTYVETPIPRKKRQNSSTLEAEINKRRSPDKDRSPSRLHRQSLNASLVKTEHAIENGLALHDATALKKTLGMQKGRNSQYVGWTTEFEPCLVELLPLDEQDESSLFRGTLRKVSDHDTFLMRDDYLSPKYEEEAHNLELIQQYVGPYGSDLVNLYFDIVHPSFPILHKDVFLQRYARSYQGIAPALLGAVYILAFSWWHHSPNLAHMPCPDVEPLETLTLRALSDATNRPKLSTVQAGLILLQRPEGDSWVMTAQMVALGQELGLHMDCSRWTIPAWERGLRKRLAWALYMQDKWSSLVHGRPSHIDSSGWVVRPLRESDFPTSDIGDETGEEEDGRLLFTHMVSLTEVLAEILDTFYTARAGLEIRAQGPGATRYILDRAKPVQIKLKEWFTRLPACLRMDTVSQNKLSSIGYLHLAYYATEIELHRLIIRSLTPLPTPPALPTASPTPTTTSTSLSLSPPPLQTTPSHPPLDPYLTHICRSAAKTRLISAMDFVNRLKPTHLTAFWHFASKVNFALIGTFGCLLWASAPGAEEAAFYRVRLDEYKWTLRVSVRELGFMRFAATHLDAAVGLLNERVIKRPLSEVYGATAASGGAAAAQEVDAVVKDEELSPNGGGGGGGAGRDSVMLDRPSAAAEMPAVERFRFDPAVSGMSDGEGSLGSDEEMLEDFEEDEDDELGVDLDDFDSDGAPKAVRGKR